MAEVPTIRQIAALAGVSRTTVSLALRNHPSLPAVTRERIQQLAVEKGYQLDPVVSSLMNQLRIQRRKRATEKIAFLTSWDTRDGWRADANVSNYHRGAGQRAAQLGYEIEAIWAKEPGLTAARLSKILYTRSVRGVIVAPLLRPVGHLSLNWPHFSVAALGYTVAKPELHRVTHFHFSGMMLALRRLRHSGCKRIGFANLIDQDRRVNHGWIAGYLTFQNDLPASARVPHLLVPAWSKGRFSEWLDRYRPDAVVSNTPDPLRLLRELGRRVPQDVAYASLDRVRENDPWAGIDQRACAVGAAALELVVSQLQSNEFGIPDCPKTVTLNGIWRAGPTVRPVPRAAAVARKL